MIHGRQRSEADASTAPITDAFLRLDDQWRFREANERARRLLGSADLEGRVIWDEFPEASETDLPEQLHRAHKSGRPDRFEVDHRDDRYLEVHAYPTESGVAVTMHERPEEGANDRHAALVAAADVPMFALDAGGQFVEVNDALASLVDRERSDLVGTHVSSLVEVADDTTLREILARGRAVGPIDLRVEDDGARRHFEAEFAPVPSEGELVCVMHEVTGRERRKRRLSTLEWVVDHAVRNDLNVVRGRADAVAQRADEEAVVREAERIADATEVLLSESDSARRFASAIDPDSPEAVDAFEGVREAVDRARSADPEARVRLVVGDGAEAVVPKPAVLAVEQLLQRSAAGGGSIRVDLRIPDGDPVRVELARDDGEVVSPAERATLGAGQNRTPQEVGDLGLWIVEWGIEQSGGEINVDGSSLALELPRVGDA